MIALAEVVAAARPGVGLPLAPARRTGPAMGPPLVEAGAPIPGRRLATADPKGPRATKPAARPHREAPAAPEGPPPPAGVPPRAVATDKEISAEAGPDALGRRRRAPAPDRAHLMGPGPAPVGAVAATPGVDAARAAPSGQVTEAPKAIKEARVGRHLKASTVERRPRAEGVMGVGAINPEVGRAARGPRGVT